MSATKPKMLTPEQAREKLKDRKLSYVAEKCGSTYMSLNRLMKGKNPSIVTLEKLSEYFKDNP